MTRNKLKPRITSHRADGTVGMLGSSTSKKSKKAAKKAAHVEALRVIAQAKVTEALVLKDCVEKILELIARVELLEKRTSAVGARGERGETGARGERGSNFWGN